MPLTSVGALAAAVTRVLLPVREPVLLLGHSLGGMVALRLARAGQLTVRGLILCGVPSPQRIAGVQVAADVGASDEELLGELARLGGVPPAVMKSVEFARHFLPPLRADLAAYAAEADDWARGCFAGLPRVRVLVVTGDADPLAPPDCLRDWVGFAGRVTAGLVPGGHFFPQQNAPALAGLLKLLRRFPDGRTAGTRNALETLMLPFQTYSVIASFGDKSHHLRGTYRDSVIAAARLAERFCYTGALLHYNLHSVDPWCVAPLIFEFTEGLIPLIATPATAAPPHTIARHIAACAALYQRRVAINVVTGADPAERAAVGDDLGHDERYERAEAHVRHVMALARGSEPLSANAAYWSYREMALRPGVPREFLPEIFVAGSSPGGLGVAARAGDVVVTHATGPDSAEMSGFLAAASEAGLAVGIRVGIIARATGASARAEAAKRFPANRGALLTGMKKLRSESFWVRSLANAAFAGSGQSASVSLSAFSAGQSHSASSWAATARSPRFWSATATREYPGCSSTALTQKKSSSIRRRRSAR